MSVKDVELHLKEHEVKALLVHIPPQHVSAIPIAKLAHDLGILRNYSIAREIEPVFIKSAERMSCDE